MNAIALVIHNPARPAPFVSVATENSVVTSTAIAPSTSKLSNNQRFVIQNVYHIFVVVSIFTCRLFRKRFSAENARTVTMPSSSSPKSEKMGERVLDSMRRRSRPVLRYPIASSRYPKPMKKAGTKKAGKTTLLSHVMFNDTVKLIYKVDAHATTMIDAKKPAREELTA